MEDNQIPRTITELLHRIVSAYLGAEQEKKQVLNEFPTSSSREAACELSMQPPGIMCGRCIYGMPCNRIHCPRFGLTGFGWC